MYRNAKYIIAILAILLIPIGAEATYTFNSYVNTGGVWRYNASDSTFTAIGITGTKFDYFGDSCTEGDYLLIAASTVNHARNVQFSIDTAMIANNVQMVWEYQKTIGDWQPLTNVNDTTKNLTITGLRNVTFDMPERWDAANMAGVAYSTFTRMRLENTSPTYSCTEGGNQTNVRLYRGNNLLTIANEGTQANPITWQNVYDNDTANGWGVVQKYGSNYFRASFIALTISSTTYMKSEEETFEWLCFSAEENTKFNEYFHMQGYYRMGDIDANGDTYKGALFIANGGYRWRIPHGASANLYVYDSFVMGGFSGATSRPVWEVYGNSSTFIRANFLNVNFVPASTYWSMDDVYAYEGFDGIRPLTSPTSMNNVKFRGYNYAPYFSLSYPEVTISNSDLRHNSILIYRRVNNMIMLNHIVPLDDASMNMIFSQGGVYRTGELFDKYEFDIIVVDEAGDRINKANVTITDAQGLRYSFLTNTSGQIPTQNLIRKHYGGKADGSNAYDTFDHNPHTISITNESYFDLNYQFNVSQKEDWTVSLQDYPFVVNGTIIISQSKNSVIVKQCSC